MFLAAVAQQQVALAVEGRLLIADFQRRGVDVHDAQRDVARLGGGHHRCERQTGIEASVEPGDQRHTPQNAIGIGRRVQET